jgi:hypothetical protein
MVVLQISSMGGSDLPLRDLPFILATHSFSGNDFQPRNQTRSSIGGCRGLPQLMHRSEKGTTLPHWGQFMAMPFCLSSFAESSMKSWNVGPRKWRMMRFQRLG